MSKAAKIELSRTEFRCHAPNGRAVFLAGTFNNWDFRKTPMQRQSNGDWLVVLELAPGFHHYKFLIDDAWCCGPDCPAGCTGKAGCDRCVPNQFGTMDRVMVVG